MRAAARRFGGTGPRAYRRVLTPSGGSTTSGNGGAARQRRRPRRSPPRQPRESPMPPIVSAASYRHAAEVGALFIGPPLFPAFGVVVADVFDAQLLVFVLQHPVGRVALFCGVRRATSSRSATVSVAARGASSVTRFSRSYAASSSRTSAQQQPNACVRLARDGCCCLRSSESSPLSFVENSVDNTPVKGFASGLSAPLDRRVAARVSNERGLRL